MLSLSKDSIKNDEEDLDKINEDSKSFIDLMPEGSSPKEKIIVFKKHYKIKN